MIKGKTVKAKFITKSALMKIDKNSNILQNKQTDST